MLAGDKQTTHDGTPTRTRKVYRMRRPDGGVVLFGCTGTAAECQLYRRWAGGNVKDTPQFSNLGVLSIDERRRIWISEEKMFWERVNNPFWAVGSGANYALGAMANGATAREAVLIANRMDVNCGFGVDVVRFR